MCVGSNNSTGQIVLPNGFFRALIEPEVNVLPRWLC
jgi:hypothetical protein